MKVVRVADNQEFPNLAGVFRRVFPLMSRRGGRVTYHGEVFQIIAGV